MSEDIHTYVDKPTHNDKKIIRDLLGFAIDQGITVHSIDNKQEYAKLLHPLFDAVLHNGGYYPKENPTVKIGREEYTIYYDSVLFFKTVNAEQLGQDQSKFVKDRLQLSSPSGDKRKSIMFIFFSLPNAMTLTECKNLTAMVVPESINMWKCKSKDEFLDGYIDKTVEKYGSNLYLDTEESDTELRRLSEIFWFIDFLKGIYKYKDDLQEIIDYVDIRQRNV